MSGVDGDPVVRRAIDELREVPRADPAAVARIVAAAAAARVAPADDEPLVDRSAERRARGWRLAAVAAAAAFAGFVLSDARSSAHSDGAGAATVSAASGSAAGLSAAAVQAAAPDAAVAPGSSPLGAELQPAANGSADALPVAKQFVFNSRVAHTVSVVGDFNGWNPKSAPLTRAADGDLWSVTLPIRPGRHLYAFMVDDSLFVLDPREATGRDADLGVAASIVVVGRP